MKLSDKRLANMSHISKGQLFKHLEIIQKRSFQHCQFDYALPANWVNYVCKQGVDGNLLRKTTVWNYANNRAGEPYTVSQTIQDQLNNVKY